MYAPSDGVTGKGLGLEGLDLVYVRVGVCVRVDTDPSCTRGRPYFGV